MRIALLIVCLGFFIACSQADDHRHQHSRRLSQKGKSLKGKKGSKVDVDSSEGSRSSDNGEMATLRGGKKHGNKKGSDQKGPIVEDHDIKSSEDEHDADLEVMDQKDVSHKSEKGHPDNKNQDIEEIPSDNDNDGDQHVEMEDHHDMNSHDDHNVSVDEKDDSEDHEQGDKGLRNDDDHPKYEATLRAIMNTYPDTEVPNTFLYGYVTLRFNPDGSFLTKLNINGLLPNCLNCGAHAHEGTSCDSSDAPGGHFWNQELLGSAVDDDPWNYVFYNATDQGTTTAAFFINSGHSASDLEGHAFVIHTEGGARIGCGVLKIEDKPLSLETSSLGRYPGYSGPLEPSGSVKVQFFSDDSFTFSFHASGLSPDCVQCGVHIHEGLSCEDDALVLGHYWDSSEQYNDPWVASSGAYYNTDKHGTTKGSFSLFSGYNLQENIQHAVVFHDQDGSRVACGILKLV